MVEQVLIQSLPVHRHLAVVQLGVQLLHSVQIEAGLTVSIVLFYHLQLGKELFCSLELGGGGRAAPDHRANLSTDLYRSVPDSSE